MDDNVDAADMLGMFLTTAGYEVTIEYHPAAKALQRVSVFQPHVCILDIGLRDIDGYELSRRLLSLPGMERIHLVAVSGYGQPQD